MSSADGASEPAYRSTALSVAARALSIRRDPIVLIDGPSGSGKSTFADVLAQEWPGPGLVPQAVRMDDIYPGWCGLAEGSRDVAERLLGPLRHDGAGRWRRWDWAAGRSAEWHPVQGENPLIVEGCGCLTRATAPLADLRVWLTASDDVRKERALARDAGGFEAHWDQWQEQWERLVDAERPEELADIVLDTTLTVYRGR